MNLSALLIAILLFAGGLAAQEASEPLRGPDSGTSIKVHGIQVLPVSGRPFSARDHIEWTRSLEDGGVVGTELYATVARDSQGRIYREHVSFVPVDSNQQSTRIDIVIFDPVALTVTTCKMANRRCVVERYHPSTSFQVPPEGPFAKGTRYLARENLGTQMMDSLEVVGSRETILSNPGAVGNSRTMISRREFWYSAALQGNVSVTRDDPRDGKQVLTLVDLAQALITN